MSIKDLKTNGPRDVSVSFRLTQKTADELKCLGHFTGTSQADVLEFLIKNAYAEIPQKETKKLEKWLAESKNK